MICIYEWSRLGINTVKHKVILEPLPELDEVSDPPDVWAGCGRFGGPNMPSVNVEAFEGVKHV